MIRGLRHVVVWVLSGATLASLAAEPRLLAVIDVDAVAPAAARAATFLQSVGVRITPAEVQDPGGALFLAPEWIGIDLRKPVALFFLVGQDSRDRPVSAARLPLLADGDPFLAAMRARYEGEQVVGNVRLFLGALHADDPDPLFVALAESHALLATSLEGLHWLARRCRDRDLPRADATPGTPLLRLSLDGPLLGAWLEREMTPDVRAAGMTHPATASGAIDWTAHLRTLGGCCAAWQRLDVGVQADGLALTLAIRAQAPSNTPLARAVRELRPPAPEVDRFLPEKALLGAAGGGASLLACWPSTIQAWLERLACETVVLGTQLSDATPGWIEQWAPELAGDQASGLLATGEGGDMTRVQLYALRDAARGRATLQRLVRALPATRAPGSRSRGGVTVWHFTQRDTATNRAARTELNPMLTRLTRMDGVELAVVGDRLLVAEGAPLAIDPFIDRLLQPTNGVSSLERARGYFHERALPGELIAAHYGAPLAAIRRMVAAIPGVQAQQLDGFPRAGDGFGALLLRQDESLTWVFRLPATEGFALYRLRSLDEAMVQELRTQLVLGQFQEVLSEWRRVRRGALDADKGR